MIYQSQHKYMNFIGKNQAPRLIPLCKKANWDSVMVDINFFAAELKCITNLYSVNELCNLFFETV